MAEKRTISIRFHKDNKADMQLYKLLEEEAGASSSIASVAKARIRDSYNRRNYSCNDVELQDKIVATIREEMHVSGLKIAGVLLSGINKADCMMSVDSENHESEESRLPEESTDLPSGALDFLEE